MKKMAELFMAALLIAAFAVPAFADSGAEVVPADSWEFDALARFASVEDYPDGLGAKPVTRGEAAEIIARLLPVDSETTELDEEALETLEKLVDEFSQELAFLGLRVNSIYEVGISRD